MKYQLNRDGQYLGDFSLEELRRRRAAGELAGNEMVWTAGMERSQTLDSLLQPGIAPASQPPPLPPRPYDAEPERSSVWMVLFIVGMILLGALVTGLSGYFFLRPFFIKHVPVPGQRIPAMAVASRPVVCDSNTLTAADVVKAGREFRLRQYLEGYRLRGERNPECDALAQAFIGNWIATHYNGTVDTNLPSLPVISDQLANDPACTDPVVLTVAAVECVELHEAIRRLERAVKGFENSKHLGYPKLYATATLAGDLIHDRTDRLPVLDAQALQYLKEALTDGSIRPADQAEIAEILIDGWGRVFFDRNPYAVYTIVQARGEDYKWLALVLEGEHEISAAWQARGNGYASAVSEAGWSGFRNHLATARQCFTQAWKLRPGLPLAPCRMIYVSLGDADIGEMRAWFDRTTAAQLDYARAWSDMRWGLRPRWYGDPGSMLAFGLTALKTRRFDTDAPRVYFDAVTDVAAEVGVPAGQYIYGREDIWPHLQELYEGYIAEPSLTPKLREGWRNSYAVVAFLAGKYAVAQKQLEALNWQMQPRSLDNWGVDLTTLPQEVAARTGAQSQAVGEAEDLRRAGDVNGAIKIYTGLAEDAGTTGLTRALMQERLATLKVEAALAGGGWVDFMPTDTNFTGWHAAFGKFKLLPDGALEASSDPNGHLLYSRVRTGTEFEVRGQFEVVSSTTKAFQGGLVMGIPQFDSYNWYAFRIKRNSDEGDVTSFSQHWSMRQILMPVNLDSGTNSFTFRFHKGRVSATVDGREVFTGVLPPKGSYVTTNEFYLGLGAFNDSNSTVIRYRNIQVRKILSP